MILAYSEHPGMKNKNQIRGSLKEKKCKVENIMNLD
jgi:hypothetical protein